MVIGYNLKTLQDLPIFRTLKHVRKIMADLHHPEHKSGKKIPFSKRLFSIRSKTTRHKYSFFATAVGLSNKTQVPPTDTLMLLLLRRSFATVFWVSEHFKTILSVYDFLCPCRLFSSVWVLSCFCDKILVCILLGNKPFSDRKLICLNCFDNQLIMSVIFWANVPNDVRIFSLFSSGVLGGKIVKWENNWYINQ